MNGMIWFAIVICITQSAMLSGLNLAFFSMSRLSLEVEVNKGNPSAGKVLQLRERSNLLLVTILWANVAVNVLLALLSESALAGFAAFLFSTVLITIVGEIIPQALFSRHALAVCTFFAPVISVYQIAFFPVAAPTAWVLDRVLGKDGIRFFREVDLQEVIKLHAASPESDIGIVEGTGSVNFLAIDDAEVSSVGEMLDPESVLEMEFTSDGRPDFPLADPSSRESFLRAIDASQKKWVILIDADGEPRLTVNAHSFLRSALLHPEQFRAVEHCHRPIVVRNPCTKLGTLLPQLKVHPERADDDVVDQDIILLWSDERRVITGSDILGRLLRGITQRRGQGHDETVSAE